MVEIVGCMAAAAWCLPLQRKSAAMHGPKKEHFFVRDPCAIKKNVTCEFNAVVSPFPCSLLRIRTIVYA